MRIKIRTLVILITQGISQVCKIALGMIIVRMLLKEDVGTYRQAFLVYTFLGSLFSLNLESSLYYFVPRLRETRMAGLLLQTFTLTSVMGLMIAAMMYWGAELFASLLGNPEIVPLVQILCLYPFGEKMLLLIPSFLISENRAIHAGIYTVVGAVLRISLVYGVLATGGDLTAVCKWLVIGTASLGMIGCLDIFRFARKTSWTVNRGHLREQLGYCLPLLINSGVAVLNLQFDKYLVSTYFDVATFAVYSCGAMDLPMIALITSSVSNAIMPNLVNLAREGNFKGTVTLWQKAMRKSALAIFPAFVFFMVIGRDFMVLLYGESYAEASWPFRIYLLGLPIRIAVYSALLRALGQTRPIALSALVGLVSNVVISTSLIYLGKGTLLSFTAPAIGTIVSYFAIALYCLSQISRHVGISISKLMSWGSLLRLMIVFLVAALPIMWLEPGLPLVFGLMVKAVIFAVLSLAVLHFTGTLEADETAMLQMPAKVLRKLMGRLWR